MYTINLQFQKNKSSKLYCNIIILKIFLLSVGMSAPITVPQQPSPGFSLHPQVDNMNTRGKKHNITEPGKKSIKCLYALLWLGPGADALNALKEVRLSIKRSGPASGHAPPTAEGAVSMVTARMSRWGWIKSRW